MITRADREQSRQYQFEALQKNGYQKTEYKNVVIFWHPTDLILKSFWGTAANHSDFIRYRTIERLNQKIEEIKQSADIREKYAQERKEKNKGYKSSHAAASAAIKAELQKAFPGVKFSVKSESYSMGDSVGIHWTDGPTADDVIKISGKYQYGSFNGMEDIYEYTNRRNDIPQTKYVTESRTISDEIAKSVQEQIEALNYYTPQRWEDQPDRVARQLLSCYAIPLNHSGVTVKIGNTESASGFARCFELDFLGVQEAQPKPEIKGKIQIVSYSDKSIAVIGETYAIKEALKELGGKFNKFLSCGPGWIFPLSKLDELKAALTQPEAKIVSIEKAA